MLLRLFYIKRETGSSTQRTILTSKLDLPQPRRARSSGLRSYQKSVMLLISDLCCHHWRPCIFVGFGVWLGSAVVSDNMNFDLSICSQVRRVEKALSSTDQPWSHRSRIPCIWHGSQHSTPHQPITSDVPEKADISQLNFKWWNTQIKGAVYMSHKMKET